MQETIHYLIVSPLVRHSTYSYITKDNGDKEGNKLGGGSDSIATK